MTTTTLTEPTSPQPQGLAGGEPVVMTAGEYVCTLGDGQELRIEHSPQGYGVLVTRANGTFPVSTLMQEKDVPCRFPDRGSAIAEIWKQVSRLGVGVKAVAPDPSLLPNDRVLLKQIILWLSAPQEDEPF